MNMKSYVADELFNKVYHLNKALEQAKQIIKTLEEENKNLKEIAKYLDNEQRAVAA